MPNNESYTTVLKEIRDSIRKIESTLYGVGNDAEKKGLVEAVHENQTYIKGRIDRNKWLTRLIIGAIITLTANAIYTLYLIDRLPK